MDVRLRHLVRANKENQGKFERLITLHGPLTEEQRQRLLEIADRCPVSETLKRSSEIANLLAPTP